jgi:hypothetical protein
LANSESDDVSVLLNRLPGLCEIDVQPRSLAPVNLNEIPVAILGSESFDVMNVDVTTLRFGPAEAVCVHDLTDEWTYNEHLADVNLDGYPDLMTHFLAADSGLSCNDQSATLTGSLMSGEPFEGTDFVYLGECRTRRPHPRTKPRETIQRQQSTRNSEEQQHPGDLVEEQRVD